MLDAARAATRWQTLLLGHAERLPFPEGSFDLVMSTDVIHHIGDREAYFREAARVLRPGGRIVTVTDSADDIRGRRPLSSHFPETVAIELRRYPSLSTLLAEMNAAGFPIAQTVRVGLDYELESIDAYRDRAFSSLLLIDDEAFARGIARLEAELARGPVQCRSLYTLLWGTRPGAEIMF
jgi:ubiquinone/menaquinone biosynthesis C-methylase UbiE